MSILGEWAYYLLVFLSGLMLSKKNVFGENEAG
jgi:hypothetical protein